VGNNESTTTRNVGKSLGDFDCHADAAVQRGAYCPMVALVECLRRIAPTAATVAKFE
jgi:hypothetical protein